MHYNPAKLMYTQSEGETPLEWPLYKRPTDEWLNARILPKLRDGARRQIRGVVTWEHSPGIAITFHALFFTDGRIWDTVNGWREIPKPSEPPYAARGYSITDIRCPLCGTWWKNEGPNMRCYKCNVPIHTPAGQ